MHFRRLLQIKPLILCMFAGHFANAQLIAPSDYYSRINLNSSKLTVQIGAQWLDVEEEGELELSLGGGYTDDQAISGSLQLPKHSTFVGILAWNEDTILMAKLRGKAVAKKTFDSMIAPQSTAQQKDPILLEQIGDSTYKLSMYPFYDGIPRKIRMRYLIPLTPGDTTLDLSPVLAKSVNGSIPKTFSVNLNGSITGIRISHGDLKWPIDLPYKEQADLSKNGGLQLAWPSIPSGDGTRAIWNHADSGAWSGDYILYSGSVPDSILSKTSIRSETVVLWKWLQPSSFVVWDWCYEYGNYNFQYTNCPSNFGNIAIQQAAKIKEIAEHLTSMGNRFGLIVDRSMDDSVTRFPLADSSSPRFKEMTKWLGGINRQYLLSTIQRTTNTVTQPNPTQFDLGKLRSSFRVDVKEAGSLYSSDSGFIRHFLIVTVGPNLSAAFDEPVDSTLLGKGISLASSILVTNNPLGNAPGATWPGIDLAGFASLRKGGSAIRPWNGVNLPRTVDSLAARLSIQSASGRISKSVVIRKSPTGKMVASLNAQGTDLSKSITWSIYDENGTMTKSWDATPNWIKVSNDSVVPRLWAKSETPISPNFDGKDLAPIFGYVDPFYSLLATRSDTVNHNQQASLQISGVPFLTSREIFARQGYGGDASGVTARRPARASLNLSYDISRRVLRMSMDDSKPIHVDIHDLRGRLVASWSASDMATANGRIDWKVPAGFPKGMAIVRWQTESSTYSGHVMIQ